jgi:hypothetical protein
MKMPPMNQDLKSTIPKYINAWRRMSRVYASISIILRGTLIVASSLVAAKLGIAKLFSDTAFAVLSIYVAAGTGAEAWLKPREKWRGFMTDCENAEDLLMRLENADTSVPKAVDEIRTEFQRILATHREKNVF